MIRHEYHFDRALSEDEARLLVEMICWRRGSRVIEDQSGVIGCVTHPDDVREFQAELSKRGTRLKVSVVGADPEPDVAAKPWKWEPIRDEDLPF